MKCLLLSMELDDSYFMQKAYEQAELAFEIDEVIDPAASRDWILAGLKSVPTPPKREGKKKPVIDTW